MINALPGGCDERPPFDALPRGIGRPALRGRLARGPAQSYALRQRTSSMTSIFRAMMRPAQWLLLCGSMALALPGCGNSSKKAAPGQQPAAANAEEKAEA